MKSGEDAPTAIGSPVLYALSYGNQSIKIDLAATAGVPSIASGTRRGERQTPPRAVLPPEGPRPTPVLVHGR